MGSVHAIPPEGTSGVPGGGVIYVSTESDFGTVVAGVGINVIPNKTFIMVEPITQTEKFLFEDNSSFQLQTSSRQVNFLTYTNTTEPQFFGFNVVVLFDDVNLNGNGTGTLFDLTGRAIVAHKPDFENYKSGGIARDLNDFFLPGAFFEFLEDGIILENVTTASIVDCIAICNSGNPLSFITVRGSATGANGDIQLNHTIFNNNDGVASYIRIDPDVRVGNHVSLLGNNVKEAERFYEASGADGTYTAVSDSSIATTSIDSVTNSSNKARFNHSGADVSVFQLVTLSGFVTNTRYNGFAEVTAAGAGFFELRALPFGTDEAVGSYQADSVIMTDASTTLVDGDRVTIDTDDSTDYDNGCRVYNKSTNSFEVSLIFTVTKTGIWSTRGLTQKSIQVLAGLNVASNTSMYIGSAYVNDNNEPVGAIINNTFTDCVFGTVGSALIVSNNMERFKLIDPVKCILQYFGSAPFDGKIKDDYSVISSGGAVEFRIKWQKDSGSGFVDLDDNVEALAHVGGTTVSVSKERPLLVVKGDFIKPQITRNSGSSGFTFRYASINITL